MSSLAVSDIFYKAPWPRGPVEIMGSSNRCIYCGRSSPQVELTDEHIIADGLGGDLVYRDASCHGCAKHTNSFEAHVINSDFQFARGAIGVRSRKRKSPPLTASVEYGDGEIVDLPLAGGAPFMLAMPVTDQLPGMLIGARPEERQTKFRLGLFGQPDWHPTALQWVGGKPAQFRKGYNSHMGVIGQVIAKTAHAYACARLGPDAFVPFLTEYILAKEPAFDAHLMGIYSSHDTPGELHQITINIAPVPRWTAVGPVMERVYLVGLRFFANRPTPSFIAVVGRPIGDPAPEVPAFGGMMTNPQLAAKMLARSPGAVPMARRKS